MLKLFVEREVTSPMITIRWCIDQVTLADIKNREIPEPYLLLVTYHEGCAREDRVLVPLEQMMEFVQVRYPGENRFFATIVWDVMKGHKGLCQEYLSSESGRFFHSLVYREGSKGVNFIRPKSSIEEAELIVEVPKELFAKEPPAWEKRWVNFWFGGRAIDQCQHRRRRFVAYTIQPPVVLAWLVFKMAFRWILAAFLLAAGFWFNANSEWDPRKWYSLYDFKALVSPWKSDLDDLTYGFKPGWENMGPFINVYFLVIVGSFILCFVGIRYALELGIGAILWLSSYLKPVLARLKPLADTVSAGWSYVSGGIADSISRLPIKRMTIRNVMIALVISLIAAMIMYGPNKSATELRPIHWGMLLMMLAGFIISVALSKIMLRKIPEKQWGKNGSADDQARRERQVEQYFAPYEVLLCENIQKVEPKKVVPLGQRVHLEYQDLKSKVCKTFAG